MTTIPTSQVRAHPLVPASNTRRPFLTPIPDCPGEFLLVVDNTFLEKIKRCHKAAQNYGILGREAHSKTAALVFGGALHEGLALFHTEQYHLANYQGADLAEVEIEFGKEKQDNAIRSYYLAHPLPPSILSYDYRTEAACLETLRHYRNRSNALLHPDYELEILADEHGPIIERAFEIPMGVLELWIPRAEASKNEWSWIDLEPKSQTVSIRIHLAWSGRIDLVARIDDHVYLIDHKTSSVDSPDYFRGFELSSQVRGYIRAGRDLWPSLDIRRFCHNGIFLKKPAKDQGLMERGSRGGPAPLYFQRTRYPSINGCEYSDQDIARWERDTVLIIEDFLHSVSRGIFPLNDSACIQKFGICDYFDSCAMGTEEMGQKYLLSDAFKLVTWNPTT